VNQHNTHLEIDPWIGEKGMKERNERAREKEKRERDIIGGL